MVPVEPERVPTGTVTFLFSDVVGSTRLWAADAEAMSASLRIHDQIFNDTIAKFSGHVFATAGDSFAAAFQRASAAVECAAAIQASLGEIDWGSWPAISVRIGLHLGEAEERDKNYFGPPVNQAARVMAVAHGGQCVLTDGVRAAAGITATDLGTHTLRDIEMPVHLYQLGTEVFPPLGSVGTGIVSLPSPRTSLVGREASVAEVRELIGAHRLVTLTGVGGCGKTRLAIEVAYREAPARPEGVWFVDLSTIADERALPGRLRGRARTRDPSGHRTDRRDRRLPGSPGGARGGRQLRALGRRGGRVRRRLARARSEAAGARHESGVPRCRGRVHLEGPLVANRSRRAGGSALS